MVWTGLLLLSAILYFYLALITLSRFRNSPGAMSFSILMLTIGLYSVCYYFRIHSESISILQFWLNFEYLFIAPLPVIWLIFVSSYTHFNNFSKHHIILLLIIPVFTWLFSFTNDLNHLLFRELSMHKENGLSIVDYVPGLWFWVDVVYLNLGVLIGNIILLRSFFISERPNNKQFGLVFLGSLAPWIGISIYILGISPMNLDLSAFGLIITGILYVYSLKHYNYSVR